VLQPFNRPDPDLDGTRTIHIKVQDCYRQIQSQLTLTKRDHLCVVLQNCRGRPLTFCAERIRTQVLVIFICADHNLLRTLHVSICLLHKIVRILHG